MKLTRRQLTQALALALDDLDEHKIAVAELTDRLAAARHRGQADRDALIATRRELDETRRDIDTMRQLRPPEVQP